jgi:hypothetical protein
MRCLRLAALVAAALASGACFQMTTVLRIGGDGSGTITHRMVYSNQALAQLRQFAMSSGRGGNAGAGGAAPFDPLSEQQARDMAASIGPDVEYVSSTQITEPGGQGRETIYGFKDVSTLRISTQPVAPANLPINAPQLSSTESITFSLTRQPNANAILHIFVPDPNFLNALGTPAAQQQIGMVKAMLAGAKLLLMAEPAGAVARSSSPYVDGNRVTLLEIDLDRMLKDETLLPRLAAAKTPDEAKAIVQGAQGLKLNLDRDITIAFTPAK